MSDETPTPSFGIIPWCDLTVDDAEGIRDFYEAVVGWESNAVEMDGYSDFNMLAPGSDKPIAGVCHRRGGNAGLPAAWLMYVTVRDVELSASRCVQLGGTLIVEPKTMGGYGRYCVIQDPAGAHLALFEPAREDALGG
jgi:predicted enzyme related to lactoylglutathione lyase